MDKKWFLLILIIFGCTEWQFSQDDYLKITVNVEPAVIKQGSEGVIKIKVSPRNGLKISSHPEFMIKFDKDSNFSLSKPFFTASELDFQTIQENNNIFLDLEKEVAIIFKVNEDAVVGKHIVSGEVIFTAVFKDNWSVKTRQHFDIEFTARKNFNLKTKAKRN